VLDKPLLFGQEKELFLLLSHEKHAVDYGTATSITTNIRFMPYTSVVFSLILFYRVRIMLNLLML
jgi:hypothetical protein